MTRTQFSLSMLSITLAGCIAVAAIINGHDCQYKHCPMKGATTFTPCSAEDEPGTDCYLLDSLHFAHPGLDYDALDSILFTQTPITHK